MNVQQRNMVIVNDPRRLLVGGRMKKHFIRLACLIASFWVFAMCAHGEPISFTNYGGDYRGDPTGTLFPGYYHQGPWTWFPKTNEPAPFWNTSITFVERGTVIGPPEFTEDGLVSVPYNGKLIIEAHSEENPEEVIGTMVFAATAPFNVVGDINPEHAIVDEPMGMFYTRWGSVNLPPGQPLVTYALEDETGVFAEDAYRLVGGQQVFESILVGVKLIEGLSVAEIPVIPPNAVGGFGEWVWTGQYEIIPELETMTMGLLGLFSLVVVNRPQRRTSRP